MKRFLFLVLFSLLFISLPSDSRSQRRYRDADKRLERFSVYKNLYFNSDLYVFFTEKPDSFQLLLTVSFANDLIQFVKKSDSLYVAQIELSTTIFDENENLLATSSNRKKISVSDFYDTNSRTIFHNYYHSFGLKKGKYKYLFELTDLDSKKSLRRKEDIDLNGFTNEPIHFLTPVVLTTDRQKSQNYEPFGKQEGTNPLMQMFRDSMQIISPFKIKEIEHYRLQSPVVFYHEIFQQALNDSLRLSYRIVDRNNEIKWQEEKTLFSSSTNIFRHQIEIDPQQFLPGYYTLQIHAQNSTAQKNSQFRLYFQRTKRNTVTDTSETDEFGPMEYIVDNKVYNELRDLNLDERSSAIDQYWKERDPDPDTPENDLRDEFLRRVEFANRNFISLVNNKKGWQTDQGKIYIIFGRPNEILHPQSPNSQYEHEIWVYTKLDMDRRFIFVFKPEDGEYVLLRGK